MMSDSLRDQIARVAQRVRRGNPSMDPPLHRDYEMADAVLPIVEAEVERRTADLTTERDRLASLVDVTRKHRQWAERSKDAAEARVADLEAVLREITALSPHTTVRDAQAIAAAALAAAAPKEDGLRLFTRTPHELTEDTEPPDVRENVRRNMERLGMPTGSDVPGLPPLRWPGEHDKEDIEPERCPADCEDGWRFNTGNAADPGEWVKCNNPWHPVVKEDTDGQPQ